MTWTTASGTRIRGCSAGSEGKIYSLSQVYCPNWQLVVNRTLAEQEGIDLPDWGDDGPAENYDEWRWDDLVELLKATTKVNADGEVEQWGLANSTARFGATSLYFMYSNGAQGVRRSVGLSGDRRRLSTLRSRCRRCRTTST